MRGDAALSYAYRADFIHGLCPCNFIACHGEACMQRRIPADYVQFLLKVPADYVVKSLYTIYNKRITAIVDFLLCMGSF